MVSTVNLFQSCYGQFAIAAVNVFTMEQALGLFSAAADSRSPIIVQITPTARNYAHPLMLKQIVTAAANIYPDVVYALHLDHGTEEHIYDAINTNYSSVMIDASHDEFDVNLRRTKAIVDLAHQYNIPVEAELGVLSGVEDEINVSETQSQYTNPNQAKEFVKKTGCDSLAVAVGTSHGAYKFSGGQGLQFEILKKIQEALPNFPLVLHGSSSVKKEIIKAINKYGGTLNEHACGVTDEEIRKSIGYGICKVNIATDLRLLWTKVHRKFFYEQPDLFDLLIPGKEYISAYKSFMIERFEILGSIGKAESIKLFK